jgi:hypothetical protein
MVEMNDRHGSCVPEKSQWVQRMWFSGGDDGAFGFGFGDRSIYKGIYYIMGKIPRKIKTLQSTFFWYLPLCCPGSELLIRICSPPWHFCNMPRIRSPVNELSML